MVKAMGGKCQCCGYDRCFDALAFHHLDPSTKDLSFSRVRANPVNWATVVAELKKSILVCHNCHSEIHAGVRQIPDNRAVFDERFASYRQIDKFDDCPKCGKQKSIKNRYCSLSCAASSRGKVDWDNIDLLDLMNRYTITQLEEMLNVSNEAIYKRRRKILKQQQQSP